MSVRALSWALEQTGLTPGAKIVLIAMADAASDTGKSYSSIGTIMRITGHAKEETITEAQKKLISLSLIADTGKRVGATGKVKVWQMPPAACKEQPGNDNSPKNGLLESPGNTPHNTPVIPRSSEPPGQRERGTGNGKALRATPPTLEELIAYMTTIGVPKSEAEACFDFYTSNGWKVGKNPMKDWQAVARNWKRGWKNGTYTGNGNGHAPKEKAFRVGDGCL